MVDKASNAFHVLKILHSLVANADEGFWMQQLSQAYSSQVRYAEDHSDFPGYPESTTLVGVLYKNKENPSGNIIAPHVLTIGETYIWLGGDKCYLAIQAPESNIDVFELGPNNVSVYIPPNYIQAAWQPQDNGLSILNFLCVNPGFHPDTNTLVKGKKANDFMYNLKFQPGMLKTAETLKPFQESDLTKDFF